MSRQMVEMRMGDQSPTLWPPGIHPKPDLGQIHPALFGFNLPFAFGSLLGPHPDPHFTLFFL
jgi:hypothetical protein